ncbi:HlyD family secretion protein [Enterobacter sp. CC120223-11]|uniref:HlyD family secretion protein n=1 Tax=Enterobacter sp. CC120223-11 TaxID=1378073 RepID=UPI000BD5853D|nr:HlyD family efflux transporter periplasmic adaptor subunit [Enterobacter sp. CC120223-11]SNY65409.1 HlyD family secretion protein [Enterobacter sp. CC120223-11]
MKFLTKVTALIAAVLSLSGCDNASSSGFSGYANGDFIYLSHSSTEKIDQILVSKGSSVKKGQTLVIMEGFSSANSLSISEKNYQAELALLRNMESGERPEELAIIRSRLEQAKSAASVAKIHRDRNRELYESEVISKLDWDTIKADYAQKNAQVNELSNQLKARELPARKEQIHSQKLRVESARLQFEKAKWNTQQNTIIAPQDAVVFDIIYRAGERPLAGNPIISLLPPQNIKVRFFVPENQLGSVALERKVNFLCDGCPASLTGHINYISAQAEYSPPVIYSTARREKLLFMAEAAPDDKSALALKLGQPVEVRPVADE